MEEAPTLIQGEELEVRDLELSADIWGRWRKCGTRMCQQNQRIEMIEHSARNQHEWGDKTEQSDQEERDEWGMLTVLEHFPGQKLDPTCLTQILLGPD